MLSSVIIFFVFASATIAERPISKCDLVRCAQVKPETCIDQDLAYVPADGVKQCCDKCAKAEDVVEPQDCDPTFCSRAFCVPQSFDTCFVNMVLVPRDGLCHCCSGCAYKKGSMKCGRTYCQGVYESCAYPTPKKCLSEGLAFVPRDFDCNCCDTCQKISEVTKDLTCDPERCSTVDCRPQTIEDCNARQVLVPAGGCYCCDSCVDKKV